MKVLSKVTVTSLTYWTPVFTFVLRVIPGSLSCTLSTVPEPDPTIVTSIPRHLPNVYKKLHSVILNSCIVYTSHFVYLSFYYENELVYSTTTVNDSLLPSPL